VSAERINLLLAERINLLLEENISPKGARLYQHAYAWPEEQQGVASQGPQPVVALNAPGLPTFFIGFMRALSVSNTAARYKCGVCATIIYYFTKAIMRDGLLVRVTEGQCARGPL
jgi:hypothetical protein